MPALTPLLKKSYWVLAALGGAWALMLACAMHPVVQRHFLYMHKLNYGLADVGNPEAMGFSKGQVTPFWLATADAEKLFCWHVLPLDVYLENEVELVRAAQGGGGGVVEAQDFAATLGARFLRRDAKSRLVVNFHGNVGHLAMGWRPSIYRSMSGIPHTHTIVCDYRGFGLSTALNAPHMPTETGLITDAISIVSYALDDLQQPASRTVLLGQSLGSAVTAAAALYFADPSSPLLPADLVRPAKPPQTHSFAAVVLAAAFTDLPELLKTYRIKGFVPVLAPLKNYPKISAFLAARVVDRWPTLARLAALVAATARSSAPLHIALLHARNDAEVPFRTAEAVYAPLETLLLGEDGAASVEQRRSVHGGERVPRGAFAFRGVETSDGERGVELELVRYGGHSEGMGWGAVNLAVRRAFKRKVFRPGLDVE